MTNEMKIRLQALLHNVRKQPEKASFVWLIQELYPEWDFDKQYQAAREIESALKSK